jgi:hypothetical protein
VTHDRAAALAARLEVDLHSPGVCPACLSFVAFALDRGDERKVAGEITRVAPLLWDEGLGDVVRVALETAARRCDGEAGAALLELDATGARSRVFRIVVRRLAAALAEEVRRTHLASLN